MVDTGHHESVNGGSYELLNIYDARSQPCLSTTVPLSSLSHAFRTWGSGDCSDTSASGMIQRVQSRLLASQALLSDLLPSHLVQELLDSMVPPENASQNPDESPKRAPSASCVAGGGSPTAAGAAAELSMFARLSTSSCFADTYFSAGGFAELSGSTGSVDEDVADAVVSLTAPTSLHANGAATHTSGAAAPASTAQPATQHKTSDSGFSQCSVSSCFAHGASQPQPILQMRSNGVSCSGAFTSMAVAADEFAHHSPPTPQFSSWRPGPPVLNSPNQQQAVPCGGASAGTGASTPVLGSSPRLLSLSGFTLGPLEAVCEPEQHKGVSRSPSSSNLRSILPTVNFGRLSTGMLRRQPTGDGHELSGGSARPESSSSQDARATSLPLSLNVAPSHSPCATVFFR